jgi:hypothetical protein
MMRLCQIGRVHGTAGVAGTARKGAQDFSCSPVPATCPLGVAFGGHLLKQWQMRAVKHRLGFLACCCVVSCLGQSGRLALPFGLALKKAVVFCSACDVVPPWHCPSSSFSLLFLLLLLLLLPPQFILAAE